MTDMLPGLHRQEAFHSRRKHEEASVPYDDEIPSAALLEWRGPKGQDEVVGSYVKGVSCMVESLSSVTMVTSGVTHAATWFIIGVKRVVADQQTERDGRQRHRCRTTRVDHVNRAMSPPAGLYLYPYGRLSNNRDALTSAYSNDSISEHLIYTKICQQQEYT